jgi:hypothetical protein
MTANKNKQSIVKAWRIGNDEAFKGRMFFISAGIGPEPACGIGPNRSHPEKYPDANRELC